MGGRGSKCIGGARRVGNYELSMCFDRAPGTIPVW